MILILRCFWACFCAEKCQSYEFSPKEKRCNLNKENEPTDPEGKFGDYLFCKKECVSPKCRQSDDFDIDDFDIISNLCRRNMA